MNNILSHMCGRLYFPMFLFRVGLLTLINMASCMVLATLFSSLPMMVDGHNNISANSKGSITSKNPIQYVQLLIILQNYLKQ